MVKPRSSAWTCSSPGGLDKPTDRDQWSWVFLNDQNKYFATNRKPKKILSKKQNPKKFLEKYNSFRKSQA